jgi:hypothetical protein
VNQFLCSVFIIPVPVQISKKKVNLHLFLVSPYRKVTDPVTKFRFHIPTKKCRFETLIVCHSRSKWSTVSPYCISPIALQQRLHLFYNTKDGIEMSARSIGRQQASYAVRVPAADHNCKNLCKACGVPGHGFAAGCASRRI